MCELGNNVGSQRWPLDIKLARQHIFLVATHSRPSPQLLLKYLLFIEGAVELEDRLTGKGTAEMEDSVTAAVAVVLAVIRVVEECAKKNQSAPGSSRCTHDANNT